MVDVESHLHRLGLSVQEASVYLALMKLGRGTVREIRSMTGLPRSRLYDVLDHLERGGWISKENTRPKLYFPEEPRRIGAAIRARVDDAWKRVMGDLTALYENSSRSHRGTIRTLRGEENVWSRFQEIVSTAKKDAIVVLGFRPMYLAPKMIQILESVAEKGILRITLPERLGTELSPLGSMTLDSEIPPVVVAVSDGQRALLASKGEEEQIAILTDDRSLVEFCQVTAEMLWSRGREKKSA